MVRNHYQRFAVLLCLDTYCFFAVFCDPRIENVVRKKCIRYHVYGFISTNRTHLITD